MNIGLHLDPSQAVAVVAGCLNRSLDLVANLTTQQFGVVCNCRGRVAPGGRCALRAIVDDEREIQALLDAGRRVREVDVVPTIA